MYFSERAVNSSVASIAILGALPYISYTGMCRCEGYGIQAVWDSLIVALRI